MKTQVIGLTGGIGSGKTTIAKYFESFGIPVYIADDEAKKILFQPDVAEEIKMVFGDEAFTDGQPDRKKIAEIVFVDDDRLRQLNNIVHPRVNEHFKKWLAAHGNKRIVIKEAAILFESGSYINCDKVILVTAPKDVRLARVMARDGVDEKTVAARMQNQWDDEKKAKLSDYVIVNIDRNAAFAQVDDILKELEIHKN